MCLLLSFTLKPQWGCLSPVPAPLSAPWPTRVLLESSPAWSCVLPQGAVRITRQRSLSCFSLWSVPGLHISNVQAVRVTHQIVITSIVSLETCTGHAAGTKSTTLWHETSRVLRLFLTITESGLSILTEKCPITIPFLLGEYLKFSLGKHFSEIHAAEMCWLYFPGSRKKHILWRTDTFTICMAWLLRW